jgi:hypothetical protein
MAAILRCSGSQNARENAKLFTYVWYLIKRSTQMETKLRLGAFKSALIRIKNDHQNATWNHQFFEARRVSITKYIIKWDIVQTTLR